MRARPPVVWFTGPPAAGKTTLARLVERQLREQGVPVSVLDGDEVRRTLCSDLGFTNADRHTNACRVAHVARLLADAGVTVLVALVSPFKFSRETARGLVGHDRFVEVFVDAPLSVRQARDPKGLYASALDGRITQLTGFDAPYEDPVTPNLRINTAATASSDGARQVLSYLRARGEME